MIELYASHAGRKPTGSIDLHNMDSVAKDLWRDHWIDKLQKEEHISSCNFITLCGPDLLDVKAMTSHGIKLETAVLIEYKRAVVNRIIDNINSKPLTRTAAIAGLQSSLQYLPTAYTILNVSFDNIVVKSGALVQSVLSQKLRSCDTVLGLDFCGAYSEKRHHSITTFLEIVRDIPQIQGKKIIAIMNFASPISSRNLNGIEELNILPSDTKKSRFIFRPAIQRSMELYGRFSENIGQKLVESARIKDARVYTPFHYHNGMHSCGYTTNMISYLNSKE